MIVKELLARWGFDLDKSGVAKFDSTIKRMKTAAKVTGAAVVAIGALAVKSARDFNKGMKGVLAELDLTRVKADDAQKAVMDLSKEFGDMPSDVQAGMIGALANGFRDLAAATEVTRRGMELATDASTEIGPTVEGLAKILRSYKYQAKDAAAVSEMLFAGKGIAGGSLTQLMEGVATIAPQARTAGIGLNELIATLATMREAGVMPNQAISGLRILLAKLANPTKELTDLTSQMGFDFSLAAVKTKGWSQWLAELQVTLAANGQSMDAFVGQLGGRAAGGVMELMAAGSQKFLSNMIVISKTTGQVAAQFAEMDKTQAEQTEALESRFSRALTEVGQKLLPIVVRVLEEILKLIDRIVQRFGGMDAVVDAIGRAFEWVSGRLIDIIDGAMKVIDGLTWLDKYIGFGATVKGMKPGGKPTAATGAAAGVAGAPPSGAGKPPAGAGAPPAPTGFFGPALRKWADIKAGGMTGALLQRAGAFAEGARKAQELAAQYAAAGALSGAIGGFSLKALAGKGGEERITTIAATINLDLSGRDLGATDKAQLLGYIRQAFSQSLGQLVRGAQAGAET